MLIQTIATGRQVPTHKLIITDVGLVMVATWWSTPPLFWLLQTALWTKQGHGHARPGRRFAATSLRPPLKDSDSKGTAVLKMRSVFQPSQFGPFQTPTNIHFFLYHATFGAPRCSHGLLT